MIYAGILAGGKGKRMGNTDLPKQFMTLGNKPIIIHTIEKFLVVPEISEVIVLTPRSWIQQTEDLIKKHIGEHKKVHVIEGGSTRNNTINNCIGYIENKNGINDDDIIITHDAVRPFLTYRIIKDNIDYGKKYGACDTVIPSPDTIVESENGTVLNSIPERRKMFLGQTPQTFNIKKLKDLSDSLSEEEEKILTDACKIFTMKGEDVYLVDGETFNIKITYQYDLDIANFIVKELGDRL